MVDNTIALQVKPIDFDIARATGSAVQSQLGMYNLDAARMRNNALRSYTASGNTDDLRGAPDLQAMVVSTRSNMDENTRKQYDFRLQQNARDANEVLAVPAGPQRDQMWRSKLDTALKEGRLDQATHQRLYNQPASDLTLNNIVRGGQAIERIVAGRQAEESGRTALGLLGGQPGGGDIDRAANAIRSIESGSAQGDYSAVGRQTRTGDRAYGAYQVMGNNVGPWTERHYGRRLTAQEFLQNREAQDAVFRGEFGGYVKQYGPEGAARAWFGGPGAVNGRNGVSDVNGTTVGGYGQRFAALYGQGGGNPATANDASPAGSLPPVGGNGPQNTSILPTGSLPPPLMAQQPAQSALPPPLPMANSALPTFAQGGSPGALTPAPASQPAPTPSPAPAPAPAPANAAPANDERRIAAAGPFPQATTVQLSAALAQPGLPEGLRPVIQKEIERRTSESGEGAIALTAEERTAYGITAEQPAYKTRKGEIKFGPAAAKTQVAIDQRQESEFGKATGAALGKRFNEMAEAGDTAVQDRQLLAEMRRLGTKIEFGAIASIKSMAANAGIKLEGASDIEAFNTLINRLTPQQRVPGSGATSDFDAKMFKESLPRLINTPEGNTLVLDTMEKIAENKIARGDIALQVQSGEMTPKQGLEALRKLQGEARSLSDAIVAAAKNGGKPDAAKPAAPARAQRNGAPAVGAVEGGYVFKGGDPASPSSWERAQ